MPVRFRDKVAVVTGAGRGIGQACALRLAHEGADVAVVDVSPNAVAGTVAAVRDLGRRALALPFDITRVEELSGLFDQVAAELGRVNILVQSAGIVQTKPLAEIQPAEWDRVLSINSKGLFFAMQAVLPHLQRASGGRIINLSSQSGFLARPLHAHYAASKAAVLSVTKSAALAFAPYGITVNAICPGVIHTPMWQDIDRDKARLEGKQPGEALQETAARVPLGRLGTPDDVAATAAFLASDEAAYMTGQALVLCGGLTLL